MGRSEVVICEVTSRNTQLQMINGRCCVPPVATTMDLRKHSAETLAVIKVPIPRVPTNPFS